MRSKSFPLRQLPHPAQDVDDVFQFLFNLVNLLNGIFTLVSNIIEFVEDLFGTSNA